MDNLGKYPVRPFHFLKSSTFVDDQMKKQFNAEWKPVMKKMQEAPDMIIPSILKDITSSFLDESYKQSMDYLRLNVCSFVWSKGLNHEQLNVGT